MFDTYIHIVLVRYVELKCSFYSTTAFDYFSNTVSRSPDKSGRLNNISDSSSSSGSSRFVEDKGDEDDEDVRVELEDAGDGRMSEEMKGSEDITDVSVVVSDNCSWKQDNIEVFSRFNCINSALVFPPLFLRRFNISVLTDASTKKFF